MGILDNLEKGLERAVNGIFARTFKSGLQPVEIIAALKRELDSKSVIVSPERILVPHLFQIRVSSSDYQRLNDLGEQLNLELKAELNKYAQKQSYKFSAPLSISIRPNNTLGEGMMQLESTSQSTKVNWVPILVMAGRKHRLSRGRTILGRGSECDIVVKDIGASREHLAIEWDGNRIQARDLGSTNGTKLNGLPFATAALEQDATIQIGSTKLVFQLEPEDSAASTQYDRGSGTR